MKWCIPKIWEGEECWIIGGGPSIPRQFGVSEEIIKKVRTGIAPPSTYSSYFTSIHDKHIIGVNSAFMLGDWIDILTFGDKGWFLTNRDLISDFPKVKVGFNPHIDRHEFIYDNIKYVPRDNNHSVGISSRVNHVSWNENTGCASINLAYQMGAKRIILLGFDMKLDDSNLQHWHGLYSSYHRTDFSKRKLPFGKHLSAMSMIKRDADRLGIEIINASPDSAITQFQKVALKDLL